MFNMSVDRHRRLAAVALALLAALLLIVDISLGAHYNNLKDDVLTTDDMKLIREDLAKLKTDYKTAVEKMKDAQKETNSEINGQTETNWEFEHQTKRSNDYLAEIEKIKQDLQKLRSHLPMINDGCKHCPEGWILMNFVCYFFSFSNSRISWQKARSFCQTHGGDLVIIDSKDKEKSIVNYLMERQDQSHAHDREIFWIGLKDSEEEGTWKWVNGTVLAEGYWSDGEPNDTHNNEDCATVSGRTNFFKTWNDLNCAGNAKWICEKLPTSTS